MQINDITLFFKGLEQSLGLPIWAIFTITIICLIFLYLYGLRIPVAVLKTRKELTNLRQAIGVSIEETKRNYHTQRPHIWKT